MSRTYKNIDSHSEEFVTFICKHFIEPVQHKRNDVMDIKMMYNDENINIIYDFENNKAIFYLLHVNTILQTLYVEKNTEEQHSEEEKTSYTKFLDLCRNNPCFVDEVK